MVDRGQHELQDFRVTARKYNLGASVELSNSLDQRSETVPGRLHRSRASCYRVNDRSPAGNWRSI
jgi:hypothetical protein